MTPNDLVSLYESPGPKGDPPPLRGLSLIDWSKVTHAHGPAIDVPAILRALMSSDPEHREFACQMLFETIWHQGDVYDATSHVVPFLYNMVEATGPQDTQAIVILLTTIAEGHSPTRTRCEGDSERAQEWTSILSKAGRDVDAEIERELRYMAELHQQLSARFDVIFSYLREGDPQFDVALQSLFASYPMSRNGAWLICATHGRANRIEWCARKSRKPSPR